MHRRPFFRALTALGAALAAAASAQAAQALPPGSSVDIQMSLCAAPAHVEKSLKLRPRGAPFEVWLFDNPALHLFGKGVRARVRDAKGHPELTLKLAEQDCTAWHAGVLPPGEGKCEYDVHGDKVAGALSLTRDLEPAAMQALTAGRQGLAQWLSPAQVRVLQGTAGAWPLPADLRPLGPTRVQAYAAKGRPYAVDISVLPGGEHFIEISRKVPAADAPKARARLEADLAQAGVPACADQSAQAANKLRALLARP